MISLFLFIFGAILLIFSIIDWKVRAIPSVFLTAFLFVVAVLHPANLFFGIMAFIMAYLLYEFDFFSGIADIKIMTMIGFLIYSMNFLFIFIGLVVVFGFLWKLFIKWRMKKATNTAFVPVFFFIYVTLLILGGVR